MKSRMDKYNIDNNTSTLRETKNNELYNQSDYSMYRDATVINTSNEIDITKIQSILENREAYKRAKSYRDMLNDKKYEEIPIVEYEDDNKDYDINLILKKAKENLNTKNNEYRQLKNTEFDILKNLEIKTKNDKEKLKQMIEDVTNTDEVDENKDLFDELIGENTIVTKAVRESDVTLERPLIKEELQKKEVKENTDSFYSDSFTFSKKDFDLKGNNNKIKKSDTGAKITIFILLVIVLTIIFFIINYFVKIV